MYPELWEIKFTWRCGGEKDECYHQYVYDMDGENRLRQKEEDFKRYVEEKLFLSYSITKIEGRRE